MRSGNGTRARRLAVVVMGAALIALAPFASPSALAHANLRSSTPAQGAQLDRSPAEVTLTFTEPPERALSSIRVLDVSGGEHQRGSAQVDPADPLTLHQAIQDLPKGVYTVAWRAVSRADGHATAGAFAFGIQVSPEGAPLPPSVGGIGTSPPPSAAEMAGRWGLIAGLVVLLGGAVAAGWVLGSVSAAVRRLLWSGLFVAVAGLVVLALAQRAEGGAPFGVFLRTTVGRALWWRAAGLAGAGGALAAVRSVRTSRVRAALAALAAGAGGAMLAEVLAGHAAAGSSWRWVTVLVQWAHFAAVGVWIGGLATLLVGIRGLAGEGRSRAVRRFSTLAGFGLLVVAATGATRALGEVSSVHRLFSTGYGAVILAKIGLLLFLAALGAVNRYRNVPRVAGDPSGLRRITRIELGVAVAVLASTAVLTGLAPAKGPSAAAAQASQVVVAGADFATSVRVRLEVTPGAAGSNQFAATVSDFDTGQPVQAERVALRFDSLDQPGVGSSTLDLAPGLQAGVYQGSGANLSLDGRWSVTVLVQRGTDAVEVPLRLATRCQVQALATPGQPTIYTSSITGGGTVQMYLDPGAVGLNEVHFTFFDPTGNELPIEGDPVVTASKDLDDPAPLEAKRFSAGHFISDDQLAAGAWRFQIVTPDTGGGPYRACFEQTVTG